MARGSLKTPLGWVTVLASDFGLVEVGFTELPVAQNEASEAARELAQTALNQLKEYFAGRRIDFALAVDKAAVGGTPFQRRIWELMTAIPFGETMTYGQLAALINKPRASRAVGGACNRNPLGIIVPCHRVIGSSGKLVGYAGGIDKKQLLLAHEENILAMRRHEIPRPLES